MNLKVHYTHIAKRVAACIVDQMIFLVCCSLFYYLLVLFILSGEPLTDFLNYVFPDTDTDLISGRYEILENLDILLENLVYIALEVLMITRLGWTPGKLLCGICIKDANTLKNVVVIQVMIRSTLKVLLFLPLYISEWFLILPIFILIPAIFDQHKQFFYDKIAKTVVTDCKTEECYLNLNYVGITRRIIAHIIDRLTIMTTSLVCLIFVRATFHIAESELFIRICLLFLLSIVFGVFMVKRFSGTPGQLLCGIHIKDSNTLKSITLVQAIIRHVSFEVIRLPFIMKKNFLISISLNGGLILYQAIIFIAIILIFIYAIFDQRKQCLHDKIAKTVAIVYKRL